MVAGCYKNINVTGYKALEIMKRKFGTNITGLFNALSKITEGWEKGVFMPNKQFTEWYEKQYGKHPDFNDNGGGRMTKAIEKYVKLGNIDIAGTAKKRQQANTFADAYTDSYARSFGIQTITGFLNDFRHQDIYNSTGEDPTKGLSDKEFQNRYINAVASRLRKMLLTRVANEKKMSMNQLAKEFKGLNQEGLLNKIREMLGGDNMSYQDQNLWALVNEMSKNKSFINDALKDGKLNWLKKRFNEDEVELDKQDDNEESGNDNENDGKETQKMMSDEEVTDPNSDVDIDLKIRLSAIKKLNTTSALTGQLDYDTDNPLGIPSRLDVNETLNTLRHVLVGVNNLEEAYNRIKAISTNIPDKASYSIIADWMDNDKNFANQLWNNLCKPIISKSMILVQDGESKSDLSNRRSNNQEALFADFSNVSRNNVTAIVEKQKYIDDIQGNSDWLTLNDSHHDNYKLVNDVLTMDPNKILDSGTDYATAGLWLHDFAESVRNFLPNVTEATIINYLRYNKPERTSDDGNKPDWVINLENLKSTLVNYGSGIINSSEVKNKNDIEAEYARRQNYALEQKYGKQAAERNEQYIDESTIKNRDFLTSNTYKQIANLATMFDKFMITDISTTSMNANRKQTSDAIDNSKVTEVIRAISDKSVLAKYGQLINKIATSPYSNILVEQDGTFGLFRKDEETGQYVPTEYADKLIHTTLFNGIQDRDNGNTSVYNQMVTADYVGTAFISFFKPAETQFQKDLESSGKIKFGSYAMRTPADAPKQFFHTAPKYEYHDKKAGDLFEIGNLNEVNEKIDNRINAIKSKKFESGDYPKDLMDTSDMMLHVNSDQTAIIYGSRNKHFTIKLSKEQIAKLKLIKNKNNGDTVHMLVENDSTRLNYYRDIYMVSGKLDIKNKQIKDVNYEGVENGYISERLEAVLRRKFMKDAEHDKDANGNPLIKRRINHNHPIFKAYKRAFMGELKEAYNAAKKFFDLENDGAIRVYTGLTEKYVKSEGRYITESEYNRQVDEYNASHKRNKKKHATDKQLVDLNGMPVGKGGSSLEEDENGRTRIVYHPEAALDLDDQLATGAYDVYHVGKSGKIFEDGQLTGRVFTSDKFEVGDTNYGNDVMQKFFNPFYRGATDISDNERYIHVNPEDESITFAGNQEEKIDGMIETYVRDYVDDSLDRFDKYKQFITDPSIPVDFEHVAEFQTNYNIAAYNYNELFDGNTKFYKDSQDLLKREKEVQAGGDAYGLGDYSTPSFLLTNAPDGNIFTGTIKHEDGTTEEINIESRKKFTAVTVNNVVRTDKTKEEELIKQMLTATPDLKPEIATAIITKAHNDIKRNDAQSFITFDEWVRRIAGRGQLKKYRKLIEAILDESKPVNENEIGEFIQPMKNVYYDLHYDEANGIMVPRFIKNAEFVLIPRFIKGSQFEDVYNWMKANGIDQLNTRETSKAGKHNVLTLWDNDGWMPDWDSKKSKDKNAIARLNSQVGKAKEEYDYRYLYTQQEPVQHINKDNKLAVQIVKKIIDNIDDNSGIYKYKRDFFDVYTNKIRRTFDSLLDEFKIPRDANGKIQIDENGNISNIDYTKLLDRLQEEALRNGLDSNLMDYFTQAPDSFYQAAAQSEGVRGLNTLMPLYDSATSTKTQSVVNAIFNSAITRQKINGFHGTQVTNIGFQAKGSNVKGTKWLKYHDNEKEPYMEIAMTYKAFGIDVHNDHYKRLRDIAEYRAKDPNETKTAHEIFDEMIIKELEEEGLDKVVSYRIPTEGKQSMSVAKITHFLDDVYGSTIIVPDEWVAQTGSDFDIDSVYGIQKRSYIDLDGRVRAYKFKDTFERDDYNRYAIKEIKKKLRNIYGKTDEDIDKLFADNNILRYGEINQLAYEYAKGTGSESYKSALDTASNSYKSLTENVQKFVKKVNRTFDDKFSIDIAAKSTEQGNAVFTAKLKYLNENLKHLEEVGKLKNDEKDAIDSFIDANDNLIDMVSHESEDFEDSRTNARDIMLNDRNKGIDALAKQYDILNEQDYYGRTANENNDDYSLDNKLVDNMINILQAKESREENLSASTFANITGHDGALQHVLAVMTPENKAALKRSNRSAYNFLDQADMMNDTMGGARLKAFSVTRDTFCSVCNTVKPVFNKNYQIKIAYRNGKVINHNSYGWLKSNAVDNNNPNRNIEGYLLTPYSSQTSAHAFDAVKEGAIPNVNEYTFAAYKLFPEIGSNYDTAVSFIMQPGISRIVDAYNRSESVFSNDNRNPIYEAIKSIAIDLGIKTIGEGKDALETSKASIHNVCDQLEKRFGADFKNIFPHAKKIEVKSNKTMSEQELNVRTQFDRFSHNLKGADEKTRTNLLLWDLGQILQFSRINSIANKITDLARVCNPDKFGAKQSIYATNKVFRDINKIIKSEEGSVLYVADKNHKLSNVTDDLSKNKNYLPFLESIYPGITKGFEFYMQRDFKSGNELSSYRTLDAFLKLSSGTSIQIARPLYKTETPEFRNLVYGLEKVFDNTRNTAIDEQTYYDFGKYILGDYYRENKSLSMPQTVITNDMGTTDHFDIDKSDPRFTKFIKEDGSVDYDKMEYSELQRIYGYGYTAEMKVPMIEQVKGDDDKYHSTTVYKTVEMKDVNHPTKEEYNAFVQLSPAQKVKWIQDHSTDDNFFKYLNVELDRSARNTQRGQQTISINSDNTDKELIRDKFEAAIFNNNPIIADAAMDIIKYCYLVEGRKMRRYGVTDYVKNNALYENIFNDRTQSLVQQIDSQIKESPDPHSEEAHKLYEDYIRSHSQISQIAKHMIDKVNGVPDLTVGDDNIITIEGKKLLPDEGFIEKYSLGKKVFIPGVGNEIEYNSYVRLRRKGRGGEVLYKIVPNKNNTTLYLIPLNKLEINEHGDFSANPDNNKYPSIDYYYKKIDALEAHKADETVPTSIDKTDYLAPSIPNNGVKKVRYFDWNNPKDTETRTESKLFEPIIEDVDKALGSGNKNVTYILGSALNDYFAYTSKGQSSLQRVYHKVRDANGSPVKENGKYKYDGYYYVTVTPIAVSIKNAINDKVFGKHSHYGNPVPDELKRYSDIVDVAKSKGIKSVSDIYRVQRHELDSDSVLSRKSDVDEVIDDSESNISSTGGVDTNSSEATTSVRLQRQKEIEANQLMWRAMMKGDNDPETMKLRKELNNHNVTGDFESIKANTSLVAHLGAKFAEEKRRKLDSIANNFPLPDGRIVSMASQEVFDAMKDNPAIRDKWLSVVSEALQFVDDMGAFNAINITSKDPQDAANYKKIQDAVQHISTNSIIQTGYQMFADNYLRSKSTNPLVQDDIITMTDGTFSETFLGGMIEDLQHNGNPLVQVVTKEISNDIATKDMLAIKRVKKFNDDVDKIMKEAASHGEKLSWDDIIDDKLRLRRPYKDKFLDDYNHLRATYSDAQAQHGEFSVEALKAKLAVDEWLTDNTHREILGEDTDEYRRRSLERFKKEKEEFNKISKEDWIKAELNKAIEKLSPKDNANKEVIDKILTNKLNNKYEDKKDYYSLSDDEFLADPIYTNSRGYYNAIHDIQHKMLNEAPEIYSKYTELTTKRNRLYGERINGIVNDDIEKKIDDLDAQIKRLTSLNVYNSDIDDFVPKPTYNDENTYSSDPKKMAEQRLNSSNSANLLREYIKTRKELDNKVYYTDVDSNFKTDLEKNLAIITKYEHYENGELMNSRSEIASHHQDYADAIHWLHQNTRKVIKDTEDEDIKQELRDAFETLRGSKKQRNYINDIYSKHPDIRDSFGNIDARKLTDEEIDIIKRGQERELTTKEHNVQFTDRTLINSAPNTNEFYTGDFYQGLKVGGMSNPEYRKVVNEYNDIVRPYFDKFTHRVMTSKMSVEELKAMRDKLDELDGIKSKEGVTKEAVERVNKFRKDNVTEQINEEAYEAEKRAAELKGNAFYNAWLQANSDYVPSANVYIPNKRLYGYLKPKEEVKSKFIDEKRTKAAKLIDKYYETKTSPYFEQKWSEVAAEAKGDTKKVQDWYNRNTIYNPRTHTIEPLRCWQDMQLKDSVDTEYVAAGNYIHRKVKEAYKDNDFKGYGAGRLGDNFKDNASHTYLSDHKFTDSQRKLIDYIQSEVLDKYTRLNRDEDSSTYNQAQRFVMNGQLPTELDPDAAKSLYSKANRAKQAVSDAGAVIRDFIVAGTVKDVPDYQPRLTYYTSQAPMPMTELLKTKNSIVKRAIKPDRANYTNDENGEREYKTAVNEYHKELEKRNKINLEENAKIASKDIKTVLGDFITKATHHNAVMDNRQMLWYLVQTTRGNNVYDRNAMTLKFKKDSRLSTEGHPKYIMKNDENTKNQVETWFRRVYLDEWKEPTSQRLNRLATYLQNFTSSTYMMLNLKGGIENVTTGWLNIGMESFAQDYIGFEDFAKATGDYAVAIPDYVEHMFDGKANTLQGAIIKFFNIVDFERMNNIETDESTKGIVETLRDWMYSPQSMGEHYMQNTMLFAMLKSHRLDYDPKTNSYRFVNKAEYTRDTASIALKKYLDKLSEKTGEDEYGKYLDVINKLKDDPNALSKYVWFRRDLVSDYALFRLDKNQQKAFIAEYDKIKADADKEFDDDVNHPTLWSQFELGSDRELHFKAGSKLAELDKISKPNQPSEAMKLMGAFKNRVIFTNKKIHGVYDKLGSAQIEKHVWGPLVMQYHKHIYPGIMKHWRRQGYYNEIRGTIEKGCYTSLADFLSIPFDKVKFDRNLSDEDVSAWKGFQNILSSCVSYARNIQTCWHLIPAYERANIRRNISEIYGLLGSFMAIFALRMIQDGTSKDNFAFNLALYEADKLQTNSAMYTPWMAQTEFRTQWSSPIAAQSIVSDITRTCGELAAMAIEGDDYDGYYHSGIYSGQFRPAVYIQRRLPIYRQIYTMSTLGKNNKAYRIGDNTLGFLGIDPKAIAENIRGVNLDNR